LIKAFDQAKLGRSSAIGGEGEGNRGGEVSLKPIFSLMAKRICKYNHFLALMTAVEKILLWVK
jgi:hypothetical protein